MKVMKFGGSSVGTPEAILRVIEIVRAAWEKEEVVVVVSAFEGVTDGLARVASMASLGDVGYRDAFHELVRLRHTRPVWQLIPNEQSEDVLGKVLELILELECIFRAAYLTKDISKPALDHVLSYGERLSAIIVSETMKARWLTAEYLDARRVVSTDHHFGKAAVDTDVSYGVIKKFVQERQGTIQVVTGFIGSTFAGRTTTLGRGGSDYTAALFGAALQAVVVEFWKDVSGVMNADPHIVPQAKPLARIDYAEMEEMARLGVKLLHPEAVAPLVERGIPFLVRNTFAPHDFGTLIDACVDKSVPVKCIAAASDPAFPDRAIVAVMGDGMRGVPDTLGKICHALGAAGVNIKKVLQEDAERTILLTVSAADKESAVRILHKLFFDS